MDYQISDFIDKFFQEVINEPFVNRIKTKAWNREVCEQDAYYHTRQILERGTADFNTGFNDFTPYDKVIIYCYYYMQMHVVSSFHVFTSSDSLLKEYIVKHNKNIVFIDFGCGPLTSGVALAWYYRSLEIKYPHFYYIGIDRCESMIRKAREISRRPVCKNCTFDFLDSYENHNRILELLESYLSSRQYKEYLILLNYSYLFASSTLKVNDLVSLVKKILNKFTTHKICVLYQNPPEESLNSKWDAFKSLLPELRTVLNKKAVLSYNNTTGKVSSSETTSIKLYFETLIRE